jgi:hypothetical protein
MTEGKSGKQKPVSTSSGQLIISRYLRPGGSNSPFPVVKIVILYVPYTRIIVENKEEVGEYIYMG